MSIIFQAIALYLVIGLLNVKLNKWFYERELAIYLTNSSLALPQFGTGSLYFHLLLWPISLIINMFSRVLTPFLEWL